MPTSFRQRIKFQTQPEKRLDEFQFDGGLVTDAHETKLKPNQSPNLYDVVFNDTGSIKTRNGYTRYNTDPIGASADQTNFGASAGTIALVAVGDYAAQTFIASGAISTLQVDLSLAMNTTGEQQYVRVELWNTSGGAPVELDADTGQSQIKLISGTGETTYSFRFRQPNSLSAATTYAAVVKPFVRGTTQTVNQVNVHRTGNAYASGLVYTSTDSGLTWASVAAQDLKFRVYAGGNTGSTGLIRYYGENVQQLFNKIGTTLYRGNDGTGVMTAITLGSGVSLETANYLDYTIVNNTMLLVDGTNKIQKYRGSTNANYTTGTLTVTNASNSVVGAGTSWNTSTNAAVGEYIKLPDGKWYMIEAITNDTTLTIEVEYQGSSLSAQTYTISPWGEVQGRLTTSDAPANLVRPTPDFIESHINRIWTLDGNVLRFSALDTSVDGEAFNDFDTSNNAGQINIPGGKGDTGTGLYSLSNSLYVFQNRAIWRLYGNSPGNFELRNVTNEIGMISKKTLVEWNDLLIFLSHEGIYYFDGSNLKNVTDGIINSFIDGWANKTSPSAVLWENKYILSYTPSGESANSEAIFIDLTRQIIGRTKYTFASAWSKWSGGSDGDEVYFASSNQGSIYKWDTGSNDDGYEIDTVYDTPSLGFGQNTNDKAAKKFYIQQIAKGDYNMTVNTVSDITASSSTSTINLSPGSVSLWDVMEWDVDSWSDEGSILTTRVAEYQGIAKFFKFELRQSGLDENVEVLGVTVTVRPRRLS